VSTRGLVFASRTAGPGCTVPRPGPGRLQDDTADVIAVIAIRTMLKLCWAHGPIQRATYGCQHQPACIGLEQWGLGWFGASTRRPPPPPAPCLPARSLLQTSCVFKRRHCARVVRNDARGHGGGHVANPCACHLRDCQQRACTSLVKSKRICCSVSDQLLYTAATSRSCVAPRHRLSQE